MEKLKCINCENHAKFDMECNIKHPNYIIKNDPNVDLSTCFVYSELHKSMDKLITKK